MEARREGIYFLEKTEGLPFRVRGVLNVLNPS